VEIERDKRVCPTWGDRDREVDGAGARVIIGSRSLTLDG